MQITLDATDLLEKKKITQKEYDKLVSLSRKTTQGLGINIFLGFGILAIAAGLLTLVTSAELGLLLSVMGIIGGLWIKRFVEKDWGLLGNILFILGGIGGSASVSILAGPATNLAYILSLTILVALAIVARSGLLGALAVLSVGPLLGIATSYHHATYSLFVEKPAVTILAYSILATGLFLGSKYVKSGYERLLNIGFRAAVLIVNFAFLVGSLWGDEFMHSEISDIDFAIIWAVALIAAGVMGARQNNRALVNFAAVFGGIHFYTQWFERLGAEPEALLIAGIVSIALGVGMWRYNKQIRT